MARDRRFVDVFDFKSFLTSRRREGRRVGGCTLIPSVYWPYIMMQHRRAIAASADGNALIDWPRSSKARGRAHLRSPPHSSRTESNYCDISICYVGVADRTGHFANRSGAQKFCPWRSVKCLKAPGRTADRRPLGAEYRPYANSGYRGVYALFIGVDRGRFDFESLDMNAPMRAATSSGFSSSAK